MSNPTFKQPSSKKLSAIRVVALTGVEFLMFIVIACSFWYQDFRYALPTPKPKNWMMPQVGRAIQLPDHFTVAADGKPIAFNFYNCDCACSRFNLDHVRKLARTYGRSIRFILVLEGGTRTDEETLFQGLNLNAEHYCDPNGEIARALGVYATPQGVVLDSEHRMVYRGNYNTGRFCVEPRTEFMRLVLECVSSGRPVPRQLQKYRPAYGCAIPSLWTKK